MPAVGRDDVVPCLCAAVVTNDHSGTGTTNEKVREQTFAGVSESEVDDHNRAHRLCFYQLRKRRRMPRGGDGAVASLPDAVLGTFSESMSGDSVRITGLRRSFGIPERSKATRSPS